MSKELSIDASQCHQEQSAKWVASDATTMALRNRYDTLMASGLTTAAAAVLRAIDGRV